MTNADDYFLVPVVPLPGDLSPFNSHMDVKPHAEITKDTPTIYKDAKLPFFTNLYVASLTVVGLFIVFRFVQKSR